MRRRIHPFLITGLLIVAAHRLPAPIQEVPESATPTPTVTPSAKPKPKPLRTRPREASATPRAQPTVWQSRAGQFAGTWTGIVTSNNPLIGVGPHPATYVINSAENSITETGPVGTFTHAAKVSGNAFLFKTGVFAEVSVSMTVVGDGRTAQVSVNDRFWGLSSGELKKQR